MKDLGDELSGQDCGHLLEAMDIHGHITEEDFFAIVEVRSLCEACLCDSGTPWLPVACTSQLSAHALPIQWPSISFDADCLMVLHLQTLPNERLISLHIFQHRDVIQGWWHLVHLDAVRSSFVLLSGIFWSSPDRRPAEAMHVA